MPAVADSLTYTFNFDAKGGVDPFTVSFTTPSFVTSGQSITFTPSNITDGTSTWSITQGEASQLGSGGPACLEFATANKSAQMYSTFRWRSVLLAMMSCACLSF
jgi:hypothetical protein